VPEAVPNTQHLRRAESW